MKRFLYVGVVLLGGLAVACADGTGVDPGEDDGGGAGGPTPPAYSYRAPVNMTPAAPEAYSIKVTLDHAQLVTDGKSLASGDDLRVFFVTPSENLEIDRVLGEKSNFNEADTIVWFRTQPDAEMVGSYFLYYGKADATGPPSNHTAVFDIYDDFEDTMQDPAWVFSEIGSGTGLPQELNGVMQINGTTGEVTGTADSLVLLQREVSGNFVVDAEIDNVGGSRGAFSRLGGLMVRQSEAEDAPNILMSIQENPRVRVSSNRTAVAGTTMQTEFAGGDMFPQLVSLQRQGVSCGAFYSDDGKTWIGLGPPASITFTDPVQVGMPFANSSGAEGYARMQWFRLRKLVLPEPAISLGEEEVNIGVVN